MASALPEQSNSASLTPVEAPKKKCKDSQKTGLRKCFSALVDRKQVCLELEVLRLMLWKELNINLDSLDSELANILPYLLVYYIKNWPGWERSVEYFSGKIQFKTWYEKFQQFINIKLNEAITTHYKEAVAELQKEKAQQKTAETRKKYMLKKIADRNTQTDNLVPKVMAPFTIEIFSKPVLLNTIVFTDNSDGDIVLKQHQVLEWEHNITETITLKQLITWPHVGVHLLSPVFAFTRRNMHEFRRHISLIGTPLPSASLEFIEEIKVINLQSTRSAYTIDFLKELTTEYMDSLKNVYSAPAILEAFQTVIDEFLTDIEELNILRNGKPTMASNTSVLFNIGKNTYFRNKKLSKGNPSRQDIGYTELIIPKMEVALVTLADEEKLDAYMKHLKNFQPDNSSTSGPFSLPQITFSCSYCQKNFENGGQIANHLKEEHKMEQAVLCALCKNNFSAIELSKARWSHECSSTQSKKLVQKTTTQNQT